jgi:predicted membrane protein
MARVLSLAASSLLSLVGMIFPFVLGRVPTALNQSLLLLMMAGVAGGFIYGAGFQPAQTWLRTIIAPAFTWPLMGLSFSLLVWLR